MQIQMIDPSYQREDKPTSVDVFVCIVIGDGGCVVEKTGEETHWSVHRSQLRLMAEDKIPYHAAPISHPNVQLATFAFR